MEDFKYITFRSIIFQMLSLILMFLFVRDKNDYIIYAIITVISSSGANLLNMFYIKKYCRIKFVIKMDVKKHLKPIILLFVMLLAQTIFNSSDITMIGLMKGDFEVGLYSTSVKIYNLIFQMAASLLWVVMPRMTVYFEKNDYENVNNMLKNILSILLLLGVPCVIGACCLSEEIVLLIAGNTYIKAVPSLKILMVSLVFSLFGDCFLGNMILLPSKREKTYMKICCVSTIVNITLNCFFIPIGGSVAAAITTAISRLIMLVMLILTKDKRIKIDYLKEVSKSPIIGSIFIFGFCIIIKSLVYNLILRIIISILGSVIIYFIILLIFKNKLCIEIMKKIGSKINVKDTSDL